MKRVVVLNGVVFLGMALGVASILVAVNLGVGWGLHALCPAIELGTATVVVAVSSLPVFVFAAMVVTEMVSTMTASTNSSDDDEDSDDELVDQHAERVAEKLVEQMTAKTENNASYAAVKKRRRH